MAFQILNEEELAFLTEEQRKNYEEELDIYQQRVAFVERMEELENVEIEPYEPKLEAIPMLGEVKVKKFQKPEQEKPVLPLLEPKPEVSVGHIKNIDSVQAELPEIHKLIVKEKEFHELKIQQPVLANVVKPEIKVKPFEMNEKIEAKLPEVKTAATAIKPFEMNGKVEAKLPEVKTAATVIKPFEMNGKVEAKLPEVKTAATAIKPFEINGEIEAKLPEVKVADAAIKSFKMAEKIQPELPEIQMPVSKIKGFRAVEMPDMNLPTIMKPETHVDIYEPVSVEGTDLPEISVLDVNDIKVFKEPEQPKLKLPDAVKTNIPVLDFSKEITHTAPELPKIQSMDAEIRTFRELQISGPELPAVEGALKIPDASAALEELLSVIGE